MSNLGRYIPLLFVLISSLAAIAQIGNAPSAEQLRASAEALVANPQVKAAFAGIDANKPSILKEWIALTEINSPSTHEQQRSAYVLALLQKMRLDDVHMDNTGNIIAVRKG